MSGEFEAIADVATGGVVARTVDGAGGKGRAAHGDHDTNCANCGTALIGPHCHRCGQIGHVHRTVGAIFHDIAHGVFHFEGRTWKTLPLLMWRPGELTRRYVHGERVKFVSPMALFLFSVFLMVATFSWVSLDGQATTGGLNAARMEAAADLAKANTKVANLKAQRDALKAKGLPTGAINEQIGDAMSDIAGLRLVTTGQVKPDATGELGKNMKINTGVPAIDRLGAHFTKNPELTFYKLQTSAYKYSWALIPISLPFIWLIFAFRRAVGLYDHAIFATYSLAAMTVMVMAAWILAAVGVWPALLWTVIMLFPPWHMYRQLKGAYRLGWFGAAWRTFFLVIAAYTAGIIFFTTILLLELQG